MYTEEECHINYLLYDMIVYEDLIATWPTIHNPSLLWPPKIIILHILFMMDKKLIILYAKLRTNILQSSHKNIASNLLHATSTELEKQGEQKFGLK